jgi:hypothetical protein
MTRAAAGDRPYARECRRRPQQAPRRTASRPDSDFDGRRVNMLPKEARPTADEQPLGWPICPFQHGRARFIGSLRCSGGALGRRVSSRVEPGIDPKRAQNS